MDTFSGALGVATFTIAFYILLQLQWKHLEKMVDKMQEKIPECELRRIEEIGGVLIDTHCLPPRTDHSAPGLRFGDAPRAFCLLIKHLEEHAKTPRLTIPDPRYLTRRLSCAYL